jgi:hypothetical protein
MSLPQTIAVRYTEEEAEYVSLRPIVRQTFQFKELVEMILSVSGKDSARIQKLLAAGSVTYHGFRYWWDGFPAGDEELTAFLAAYPDPNPALPFRLESCEKALFESEKSRDKAEISKEEGSVTRWYRRGNFWQRLVEVTRAGINDYAGYSYERWADLYTLGLDETAAAELAAAAKKYLPRAEAGFIRAITHARRVVWICPRRRVAPEPVKREKSAQLH